MSGFVKELCVDFDGVLHSYTSGWQGHGVIRDPPVAGAIAWLQHMCVQVDYHVNIYSARSKDEAGVAAMKRWLLQHGLTEAQLTLISFPTQKPSAWLTIDDRAICFDGRFPTTAEMGAFKPWYKRET